MPDSPLIEIYKRQSGGISIASFYGLSIIYETIPGSKTKAIMALHLDTEDRFAYISPPEN
jgi:hypothetical protein